MNQRDYESSYSSNRMRNSKTYQVYLVLKDKNWHCRQCEYSHVETTQIAGSGGIKGLRNGTRTRDGIEIESENRFCESCSEVTRQDRWTGNFHEAIPVGSFPRKFTERVYKLFDYRDVVEMAQRSSSHLTIDHKLPRIRWDAEAEKFLNDYSNMTDDDICENFQLLKKSNGAVSHNLLKSRSCEKCYETGLRGTPFGIKFFYSGDSTWAYENKKNPKGCIGCGWYNFERWRNDLNLWAEIIMKGN